MRNRDIRKQNVLYIIHGTLAAQDHSGRHLWTIYPNIGKRYVPISRCTDNMAFRDRILGPAKTARIWVARRSTISLLCWSEPYWPLERPLHDNVFKMDIFHQTMSSVNIPPKVTNGMELCVDSLDRLVEIGIPKCNVPHDRPTDASQHNTQSTAIDPFKQHVLGREASKHIVLYRNTIILRPYIDIVDVHIATTNVQAVCVLKEMVRQKDQGKQNNFNVQTRLSRPKNGHRPESVGPRC